MKNNNDYYVYVYIDPRNNEEFYYGKGRGKRKIAHLQDEGESAKIKRIKEIQKEGEKPKIKVVASDLTEEQAYLVESTLLWKLGKNLLNKVAGNFASKFRPHDTLHKDLPGFDFNHGIFLVNVGESQYRSWNDSRAFGFISAGHQRKYSDQLFGLQPGDIVVAYLNKCGYVGIGAVEKPPVRVKDFRYRGKELHKLKLEQPNIYKYSEDHDKSEYLVKVKWEKTTTYDEAKWKAKAGLFTSRLIRASLANQTKTLKFIETAFDIRFKDLIKE